MEDKKDGISTHTSVADGETLLSLLEDARDWGRANGWPIYERYPQYERIRRIGEMVDEGGGRSAMQQVHRGIALHDPELGSMLEALWDGVGQWRW